MHRLRQGPLQAALQTDLLVQLLVGLRLPLLCRHPGLQQSVPLLRLLHLVPHLHVTILTHWPALLHQSQLALQPAPLLQEALLAL